MKKRLILLFSLFSFVAFGQTGNMIPLDRWNPVEPMVMNVDDIIAIYHNNTFDYGATIIGKRGERYEVKQFISEFYELSLCQLVPAIGGFSQDSIVFNKSKIKTLRKAFNGKAIIRFDDKTRMGAIGSSLVTAESYSVMLGRVTSCPYTAAGSGSVSRLDDNGDGTFTHDNGAGLAVTFKADEILEGNGVFSGVATRELGIDTISGTFYFSQNGNWVPFTAGAGVNIYTDDGVIDELRTVGLANFDMDFESTSHANLFTMDASSGRVGVNANQNETFGQLHVKSDNIGADGAVLSLADNTNSQIWRQRNDGGFRANRYGSGNMTWSFLGVLPTNYTWGISDDGTAIEINGDTITRQWHYLDWGETLQGATDTTKAGYPILSEIEGTTITSIELLEYADLPATGITLRAMLYRPSTGTYTTVGDITIASGNVGIVTGLSTVVVKGDVVFIREVSTGVAATDWNGLDMEIRFLKP